MFDKLSLSGYRGKIGEGFDLIKVSELLSAFSVYTGEGSKIAIGMDKKISSNMIKSCIISCLIAGGNEIYDTGVVTTANLQLFIKEKRLNAGIMIGGFGNEDINGIRFFRGDGLQLNENEMQGVLNIYHLKRYDFSKWDKLGKVITVNYAKEIYFDHLMKAFPGIVNIIKDKKFKIKITGTYNNIKEYFQIGSKKFGFKIVKNNADVIFEINSDGSLSMIKIKDKEIDSYNILPFIILMSSEKIKKVVTNFSSSFMLKDIDNIELIETKAGMANISEKVLNEMADLGGEGCGSILFPEFVYGYDVFATSILILALLAKEKELDKIINSIPDYFYYKKMIKLKSENINNVMYNLRNQLNKKYRIIKADGIKISDKDYWITIRPSNTEDVIRIIGQAKKKEKIKKVIKAIEKSIKKIME